ncbi:hypothetical protein GC163_17855 [bacterium]|nr:hypothetical protein [bacterium]
MQTLAALLLLGQIEVVSDSQGIPPRRLPSDMIAVQYEVPPRAALPKLAQVPPPPPAEDGVQPVPAEMAPAPVAMPVTEPALGYSLDQPMAGCCSDGGCEPWVSCCDAGTGCPHCQGAGGCPTCMYQKNDGCLCKLNSTYDLYPHYAYYPRYHGYYYFRPYNYQTIAEHQQFAACIGLDPRMPYSLSGFDRIYAGFPQKYPRDRSPLTSTMPTGSGLPQLEDLITTLPTPPQPQP